jgi:hypothetical protein
MNILPDTIGGALVLSGIDFALSFIFISFIGVILYFFPQLNRLGEIVEEKKH